MANYRAVANGNWSNLATWQDDSLGYFANSTVLPTSADDVYSNNFTVTIDGVRNARLITNNAFSPPTSLGAMSIPLMTSDFTPSGVASVSSSTSQFGGLGAYGAFDRNGGTKWESAAINTAWLSYQFPTAKIIKRYGFFILFENNSAPRTWTFEGSNNNTTWAILDTQTNFTTSTSAFFSFDISSNVTSYLYYRINVVAIQSAGVRVIIPSLEMSEITNFYGVAAAGGGFTFANGGDLTCAASNGVINRDVSSVYCLTFDLPSPSSATLRANAFAAGATNSGRNIFIQNSGTFNMVGNYDIQNVNSANRATIWVNGGIPTINIIGNITNSNSFNISGSTLWVSAGTPTINITGNVIGGLVNSAQAAFGMGIYSVSASTINITGNITVNNNPSIWLIGGILNVIGNVTGGNSFPAILNVTTAATIDLLGITTSGSGSVAVNASFVKVRGNVVNTDTFAAIYAPRVVIDNNVTSWQFKDSTNTITRTLYTAGVALGNPATSNVRFGTTYGASSELTGTLRVPTAANVLSGVLVDATTGTLLMTPADFWNYLIASGFTANSIGDRLQNAATVATTGGQIAAYNI
jgi:hypothetical protein